MSKDIGTALQPSSVLVMRDALESVVRPRDGSTLRNRADRTHLVAQRVDGDLMSESGHLPNLARDERLIQLREFGKEVRDLHFSRVSQERADAALSTQEDGGVSGPIVITGMHRSGTSLLASLLRSLGSPFGRTSVASQPGQPAGLF